MQVRDWQQQRKAKDCNKIGVAGVADLYLYEYLVLK